MEQSARTDRGDQVWRIDGSPAGLCGFDELVSHGQPSGRQSAVGCGDPAAMIGYCDHASAPTKTSTNSGTWPGDTTLSSISRPRATLTERGGVPRPHAMSGDVAAAFR